MIVRSLAFVTVWALAASAALAQEPSRQPADGEGGPAFTAPAPTATPAPATAPAPAATTPAAPRPAAPAPGPATTAPAAVAVGDFKIGTEDILDIQVWKNPDLSRVVPVRPDGFISLPLVNDIRAAGLTPTQLRTQITERLVAFVPAAEVSVIVREVHSTRVSVTGAVRMPGSYEVKSDATVLDLIARAQGLTEFAKRDRIVIHRRTGNQIRQVQFNYDRASEGKEDNFTLQNGDIIVVP